MRCHNRKSATRPVSAHPPVPGVYWSGLVAKRLLLVGAVLVGVVLAGCTGDRAESVGARHCVEPVPNTDPSLQAWAQGELQVTWIWIAASGAREVAATVAVPASADRPVCAVVAPPSAWQRAAMGPEDRHSLLYLNSVAESVLGFTPPSVAVAAPVVVLSRGAFEDTHAPMGGVLGWWTPNRLNAPSEGQLWWLVAEADALRAQPYGQALLPALVGGSSFFVQSVFADVVDSPWMARSQPIYEDDNGCTLKLTSDRCLGAAAMSIDDFSILEYPYLAVHWSPQVQQRVQRTPEGAAAAAEATQGERLRVGVETVPSRFESTAPAPRPLAELMGRGFNSTQLIPIGRFHECFRAGEIEALYLIRNEALVDESECRCTRDFADAAVFVTPAERPDWWPCIGTAPEAPDLVLRLLGRLSQNPTLWVETFPALDPSAEGGNDGGPGDASVGDSGVGDSGVGDASVADAGVGDAGVGDAGVGDAGVADLGAGEAGIEDAGAP